MRAHWPKNQWEGFGVCPNGYTRKVRCVFGVVVAKGVIRWGFFGVPAPGVQWYPGSLPWWLITKGPNQGGENTLVPVDHP